MMKKSSDLMLSKVLAAACLAIWIFPGSASASVVLDLSTLGPNPFASGTVFNDPAGLGWNMTVTSSNGNSISVNNPLGLGVVGGATPALDPGEMITFAFSSAAALEGFTLMNGANDFVTYTVLGTPNVGPTQEVLPNAGGGGNDYFIGVTSLANSLTIDNSRLDTPPGSAYRVSSLTFIPVPAAVWLFASALGLLGWLSRKST